MGFLATVGIITIFFNPEPYKVSDPQWCGSAGCVGHRALGAVLQQQLPRRWT